MRENLWLALRQSRLLRRLYAYRALAAPMRMASRLLVPYSSRKQVRVRSGAAKGLLVELDPRWEHSSWDGSCEPEAVAAFLKFVKPGAVVFDVGSGLGFYAMLAGRAGADVITFEPDRHNAKSVTRHLQLNRLEEKVRLVEQAIFSRVGWLKLEQSDGTSAHHNTRVLAEAAQAVQGTTVECTTLDYFIASNPRPNLVKVDVEGAESEVLKGADRLFRVHRPVLLCEVHDEENARFVQQWLAERSYSSVWLENVAEFPRHLLSSPTESS